MYRGHNVTVPVLPTMYMCAHMTAIGYHGHLTITGNVAITPLCFCNIIIMHRSRTHYTVY